LSKEVPDEGLALAQLLEPVSALVVDADAS
jgi:hypothetical protein